MTPLWNTLSPSRVTTRSEASTRSSDPGASSAASMRMELLPISIAAYRGMPLFLSQGRHRIYPHSAARRNHAGSEGHCAQYRGYRTERKGVSGADPE
jgi:hypothetical protein